MAKKLNLSLSLIETGILIDVLKLAKRDYYSAICEHNPTPLDIFKLTFANKTIEKIESHRKKYYENLKIQRTT